MRGTMKKIVLAALSFLLALAFTACGAKEAPVPRAELAAPAAQQETAVPAAPTSEDMTPAAESQSTEASGTLVVVFSATGTTKGVAEKIASITGADLYEIVPAEPYSDADLNYNDANSRATREQSDPTARPAIGSKLENLVNYDVIFLGYPIWHGQAPKILYTFVESHDLAGKTVVPFCTSGSSGIGSSATNLSAGAPDAKWLAGNRFSGDASCDAVASWINGLGLGNR